MGEVCLDLPLDFSVYLRWVWEIEHFGQDYTISMFRLAVIPSMCIHVTMTMEMKPFVMTKKLGSYLRLCIFPILISGMVNV